MSRVYRYIALVKSSYADAASLAKIRLILESIPDVIITAQDGTTFEFRGTQTAFKAARTRLSPWCIVRREHFEHEEGGG